MLARAGNGAVTMTQHNLTGIEWSPAKDDRDHATQELRIELDNGKGRPITGAVWSSAIPGDPQPHALVLCGHGASGDRYQAPTPHLARRLVKAAPCTVLALDGPVHGLRKIDDGGRGAFWKEINRVGATDEMVADWNCAIDATKAQFPGAGSALAYFGLSMGSIFGIPFIAQRDDISVAVLGLLGTTGAVEHLRDNLLATASEVTCPLLYLMQLEDELFDRMGYLELFDALGSNDKRLHANPGLHPDITREEVNATFTTLNSIC